MQLNKCSEVGKIKTTTRLNGNYTLFRCKQTKSNTNEIKIR